jgi:hypothetical protein
MSLSESDTRAKLIDPALHGRGWTEDLIRREETAGAVEIVDGKPVRRARGRTDYTLKVRVNPGTQPVAKQTTGIATINQKVLTRFPLMAPAFTDQRQIAKALVEHSANATDVQGVVETQLTATKALPAALLRRAFRGEL